MASSWINTKSFRKMSVLDKLKVSSRETSKDLLGEDYSCIAEVTAITRPKGKDLFILFYFFINFH